MLACSSGENRCVEAFLGAGANPSITDGYQRDACYYAVDKNSASCLKLLIRHGIHIRWDHTQSPLSLAHIKQHHNMAAILQNYRMQQNGIHPCVQEQGTSILGQGSRVHGHGSSVLGWGTSVPGQGTSVLGQGTSILGQGTSILGHGTSVLGWGTSVLGQGSSVPGQGTSVLGQDRSLLGPGTRRPSRANSMCTPRRDVSLCDQLSRLSVMSLPYMEVEDTEDITGECVLADMAKQHLKHFNLSGKDICLFCLNTDSLDFHAQLHMFIGSGHFL